MGQKKILIVDDEKDIIDLLSYNLTKEGYTVLTARNGLQALKIAKEKPDIIVLDIMMPEMTGLQVIQELKKEKSTASIPVLLLTAKGSETDEVVGLTVGADDYITKPVRISVLLARVQAALRRLEQTSAPEFETMRFDELEINLSSYMVTLAGKAIVLAKKEFELLVFLAKNRGRVLSRETILNSVWGADVHVVDRTIDVHVRKVREKLGTYADFIETVPGIGYRFRS
ncbi:MAG: response regulator transcription factor [Ignavibacteriales bacterium]|nr:response regulator transcription factor [Ignavibacteriales bacterium]